MKFGRSYQAILEGKTGQQYTVGLPYTVRFRVASNGNPNPNVGSFFFYNLPQNVRADLIKDYSEELTYRRMVFQAGYETEPQLPIIFAGNIFWAYSYREGPDWITEIEAIDGGFGIKNSIISYAQPKGQTFSQLAKVIAFAMEQNHLTVGHITNSLDTTPGNRGGAVCGNAWEELVRRALPFDAQVFIDRETINIVGQDETIPGQNGITEISEDNGLIGSPRRQENMTIATMLFEPRLNIGSQVTLKARDPFVGDRTVWQIEHVGTISPSVCENLITRATFYRAATVQV